MSTTISSFQLDWPYVSQVRTDLGADSYDINPTPDNFKSGRPIYETVFYSSKGGARKVISRRQTMMLESKSTGKPYYVCKAYEVKEEQKENKKPKPSNAVSSADMDDLVASLAVPPVTILKRQTTNR